MFEAVSSASAKLKLRCPPGTFGTRNFSFVSWYSCLLWASDVVPCIGVMDIFCEHPWKPLLRPETTPGAYGTLPSVSSSHRMLFSCLTRCSFEACSISCCFGVSVFYTLFSNRSVFLCFLLSMLLVYFLTFKTLGIF